MKILAVLLFISAGCAFTRGVDCIFIGLNEGGAPSFEKRYEIQVREQLSTQSTLRLADYLKTKEFRKRISFDEFPVVSRSLVEYLLQYCSDTTVVIWGRISDYTIKPQRKNLIGIRIIGTSRITLNVYSLAFKDYVFSGDIISNVSLPKGYLFFGDISTAVTISATNRSEITEALCLKSSEQTVAAVRSIIHAEISRLSAREKEQPLEKEKETSISDLFNVPSLEAPSVDVGPSGDSENTVQTETAKSTEVPKSAAADSAKVVTDTLAKP